MIQFMFTAILLFIASFFSAPAQAQAWEAAPVVDISVALEPMPELPTSYMADPGMYTTVHARPADRRTAEQLQAHASVVVPELAQRLGVGTGRSMNIVLAHDQADFENLQPGRTHDWADGTAWPQRSLIYLKAPRARSGMSKDLEQVLEHEVVHVLLGQAFGRRPVPTWLQEGMAQYFAGEVTPDLPQRIARGMVGGGLMSLNQLSYGFPRSPQRADLAYAQSADLINWIASEYGEDALRVLVQEMSRGESMNASLYTATGVTSTELEGAWQSRLKDNGLWLAAFAAEGSFFVLVIPLALFGAWRLRKRQKETLARWEDEERRRAAYEAFIARTQWVKAS